MFRRFLQELANETVMALGYGFVSIVTGSMHISDRPNRAAHACINWVYGEKQKKRASPLTRPSRGDPICWGQGG
jgi:hypothetical protein